VEKYCRAGQASDGNMAHAHCLLNSWCHKHTLTICNTHCFSRAAKVARTPLTVTVHKNWLFCFLVTRVTQQFHLLPHKPHLPSPIYVTPKYKLLYTVRTEYSGLCRYIVHTECSGTCRYIVNTEYSGLCRNIVNTE